jgi:hypothetical protein
MCLTDASPPRATIFSILSGRQIRSSIATSPPFQ